MFPSGLGSQNKPKPATQTPLPLRRLQNCGGADKRLCPLPRSWHCYSCALLSAGPATESELFACAPPDSALGMDRNVKGSSPELCRTAQGSRDVTDAAVTSKHIVSGIVFVNI